MGERERMFLTNFIDAASVVAAHVLELAGVLDQLDKRGCNLHSHQLQGAVLT